MTKCLQEETWRKVRGYAAQPGATFTTGGVVIPGNAAARKAYIIVRITGGSELYLDAAKAELWLSGYVTGRRVAA